MLFYPLLLGALAISFPFLALLGMMIYSGRVAVESITLPLKTIAPFFVAPALLLLWDPSRMTVPAVDAIVGVGAVCLVFLLALRANFSLSSAFAVSALAITAYGLFRVAQWGSALTTMHIQTLELATQQMKSMLDQTMLKTTIGFMSRFWPASWMLSQILALFGGYVLFLRFLGIGFRMGDLRFPSYYNLLLLAILPLYFVTEARLMFYNGFIALCVIPFLQGLGLLADRLARIVHNRLLRVFVLVFLLINIISYVLITLFGFADMWWNPANIKTGGKPE